MGRFVALPMFIAGCYMQNDILLLASGLFAIAGSITNAATVIKNDKKSEEKKN